MNFETRARLNKDDVLSLFLNLESGRNPYDFFAIKIIGKLHDSDFDFYSVELGPKELRNIVLPHHNHDSHIVPKGGLTILECCKKFKERTDLASTECFRKIQEIKKELEKDNSITAATFVLLSSDKEIVHPGHYNHYNGDSLFIANGFHRLLAMALIYEETKKIKLKNIYYCEPRKVV